MSAATPLAHTEGVLLAHALVNRLAGDCDVPVLFIKGPLAAEQGLRARRSSLDVDVWVHPARRHLLTARLTELGWYDEHPYTSPTILPMHSLAFRHDRWPCELDLHNRFPGFFGDHQLVFDRMWEHRTTVTLAGQPLPVPDAPAHALVIALNCLRDRHLPQKAAELDDLVAWAGAHLGPDELLDLAELAASVGAADTAAPFLDAVGAPQIGRGALSAGDRRDWSLLTQPVDSTAVSWVEELRRLPPRAWPRYLWYAAWLSEVELRIADPALPPGRRALARARVRRLRRGLRALPAAVRSVRRITGEE